MFGQETIQVLEMVNEEHTPYTWQTKYENQIDTKVVENNYVWGIHSISDAGKKLTGQAYFEQ